MNSLVQRSRFPDSVFEQTSPALLVQQSWLEDKSFVDALQISWVQQYADYIGFDAAQELVNRLVANGEIYEHHPALTIQATVNGALVGIAALRPLKGISLITMLEIIPANQQQGIGQQLVRALDSASDKLLTHVSIHRPRVRSFYASLGFQRLDRTLLDHYGYELEFDVMAKS